MDQWGFFSVNRKHGMPCPANPVFEMEFFNRESFQRYFSDSLREQEKCVNGCFLFLSDLLTLNHKYVYLTASLCINANKQIPVLSSFMCWL